MALTAILMGALFNIYRQSAVVGCQIEKLKDGILSNQVFQQRMAQIFNEVRLSSEKEGEAAFYKLGQGLEFTYHNGVDKDPKFCDEVRASLILNEKKEVCLTLTSKDHATRSEVFFENTKDLLFSFFNVSVSEWVSSWPKEEAALPAMIKLTVVKGKESQEFAFFLNAKEQEIIYKTPA